MTVIQLECFMEVCKQRNFSKAAANLYLSQPTLSRHIQALEEELRTALFLRTGNMVRLTAVGHTLYPTLERLYQQFRQASAEAQRIVEQHFGAFRIGVAASMCLLEPERQAIRQFKNAYPNIKLQLCHLNMPQMFSALMNGSVDVLFAMDIFLPPSDKVKHYPLHSDRMCLAVPADHPNAYLDYIQHTEIKSKFPDLEFCLLDARDFDHEKQDLLLSNLDEFDAEVDPVKFPGYYSDVDDILLKVTAGCGITTINENCSLRNDPSVRRIPLVDVTKDGIHYKNTVVGVYWIDKNFNPLLEPFLQALKQQVKAETK